MITISHDSTDIVWFDLDDTIFDFTLNSRIAMKRLYEQSILSRLFPSFEEWIQRYKPVNDCLWVQYSQGLVSSDYLRSQRFLLPLTEAGMQQDEAQSIAPQLDDCYLNILSLQKKLVPGAKDILMKIRRAGIKIGILSNGFNDIQQRKLTSAEIAPLIDFLVLSENIGVAKPDIRIYRYAMDMARSTVPERNLMIGDNPITDIQGAIQAGWRAILYDRNNLLYPPDGAIKITEFSQINV